MRLAITRDHGRLVIHQTHVPIARYAFGVPLVAGGLVMVFGVGSALLEGIRDGGLDGVLTALLGAWVMLLFAAMLLPLGWWLVAARLSIVIDPAGPQVVELKDWRVGRSERRTPASAFRAVRVAVEDVNPSSDSSGPTTWCQQIRLLPREAGGPSLEIGALEMSARAEAVEAARHVAAALGLPLEVADPDARLESPARAAARAEIEAEADEPGTGDGRR